MTIEELRRLSEAATPGDWWHGAEAEEYDRMLPDAVYGPDGDAVAKTYNALGYDGISAFGNAAFIVAAVNYVRAEVERHG